MIYNEFFAEEKKWSELKQKNGQRDDQTIHKRWNKNVQIHKGKEVHCR